MVASFFSDSKFMFNRLWSALREVSNTVYLWYLVQYICTYFKKFKKFIQKVLNKSWPYVKKKLPKENLMIFHKY